MLDHANIMNRCDEKRRQVGLDALSDVERVIMLVSSVNFEVENGSLSQFYYNSAGDYAIETVWALNQVRASKADDGIKQANSLLSNSGIYLKNRGQRYETLKSLTQSATNPLEELEEMFFSEDADVFMKLLTYMDEHEQNLRDLGYITSE